MVNSNPHYKDPDFYMLSNVKKTIGSRGDDPSNVSLLMKTHTVQKDSTLTSVPVFVIEWFKMPLLKAPDQLR